MSLTNKPTRALDDVVQLVAHDAFRTFIPLPRTDKSEFCVEVGSHGPGVKDLESLLHYGPGAGSRTHVQSKLVGIALVVNGSLGVPKAVVVTGMELIVEFVGLESIRVASRRYFLRIVVLEQAKSPQLGLELSEGRDSTYPR
jgi:hypothetical protein